MPLHEEKDLQNEPSTLEIGEGSNGVLGDDEYINVGEIIDRLTRARPRRRSIVEIRPGPSQEVHKLTTRSTLFGVLPDTILDAVDGYEVLTQSVLSRAIPWCGACAKSCRRTNTQELSRDLHEGLLVAVVQQVPEALDLAEHAELLGVARGIVERRLVKVEEVPHAYGQPVVVVTAAGDQDHFQREVDEWFARGGHSLEIFYFKDRQDVGTPLGVISTMWICPDCHREYAPIPHDWQSDLTFCRRCSGKGWFEHFGEDDINRLRACDTCEGFGSLPFWREYRVGECYLQHVPSLTVEEVQELIHSWKTYDLSDLHNRLQELVKIGFGTYPIGAPTNTFSDGERTLLTLGIVAISGGVAPRLVIDAPARGLDHALIDKYSNSAQASLVTRLVPDLGPRSSKLRDRSYIVLREVECGPLVSPAIRFPTRSSTLVTGESGTGKTILLKEVIARRFAKRRKLASLCEFPNCSSVSYINCVEVDDFDTLADLVDLRQPIAELFAVTESARLLGYTVRDLNPRTSRYRCSACESNEPGTRCAICHGSRLDPRLGCLKIQGCSIIELFARPFRELSKLLLISDVCHAILERIADDIPEDVVLGSSAATIPPALRRYIRTRAFLAAGTLPRTGRGKQKHESPLLLLDRPFASVARHITRIINDFHQACEHGATIVCTGNTGRLESSFDCVLTLKASSRDCESRTRSRFFDQRYSRRSELRMSE